jgi:putative aldouronate transport system substrate-binding protein
VPRKQHAIQEKLAKRLVYDASYGLYSETVSKDGPRLLSVMTDVENQIMQGKKPVSAWAPAVKDWLSQGGEKMRAELQQAYAAGR